VLAIRGILNGTANHILTLMAQGLDYAAALSDAQAQGYAEPDPTDDVEGMTSSPRLESSPPSPSAVSLG
jgi:homoserine dehydrogenase